MVRRAPQKVIQVNYFYGDELVANQVATVEQGFHDDRDKWIGERAQHDAEVEHLFRNKHLANIWTVHFIATQKYGIGSPSDTITVLCGLGR